MLGIWRFLTLTLAALALTLTSAGVRARDRLRLTTVGVLRALDLGVGRNAQTRYGLSRRIQVMLDIDAFGESREQGGAA